MGSATNVDIIDLAGATDPEIAALPGGHTSKAVSGAFLTARGPERLVFEIDPRRSEEGGPFVFARVTERRLGVDPLVARTYRMTWISPASLPVRYVVLSLVSEPRVAP